MVSDTPPLPTPVSLGCARRGFCGTVCSLNCIGKELEKLAISAEELEMRLLELGFIEGAHVALLYEGPIGGDPIAIKVNQTTVALRRQEAMAINVTEDPCPLAI